MKVYFDLILLINIVFDFLLLTSVSIVLKRNVKFKRLILGSTVGGLTIFFLFVRVSNFTMFLIKIVMSFLMILVTFSYKNFKYFINNIIYLYLISIILGGSLYIINNEISYRNYGLVIIRNNYKTNIIFLLILTPVILFFYIKQLKKLKYNYNNYYNVDLIYKNNTYNFIGFLDTGNKLKDPYKKRPIILIYTDKIKVKDEKIILVPYVTLQNSNILKCFVADKIIIDNKYIVINPLIGLSNEDFKIDGVNLILNAETL